MKTLYSTDQTKRFKKLNERCNQQRWQLLQKETLVMTRDKTTRSYASLEQAERDMK